MASKAFFSIEFQGGAELIRELSAVELELKKVQDQIKAAQKAGDGDAYKNLRVQQEDLKRSSAELRKEIKAQATAFEKAQFPKDSLIGLEQQYSSLRAEIRGFSKDYRESAAGIAKIRLADSLKSQILEIDNSIKDFKSNIGNYKSGLSSLSNVGDIITGGLVTGGITAAIGAVFGQLQDGSKSVIAYSNSLQDLSAITGVTGEELKKLEVQAESLSTITLQSGSEIKNTSEDILEAFKLVGGAKPELLGNQEALAAVTKEAIILSKASGEDLVSSVETLTTVMSQFGAPAEEAGRIINELAAGSKAGAAETKDVAASIKEFGLTANASNIKISESVALIETLAEKQLKGAEAGNQLKQILVKLSAPENLPKEAIKSFTDLGINFDILKDKSLPLEVRLQELAKAQGQTGALAKAFGTENLQAAQILTENVDKYRAFTKAIVGTNTAYEQASIISDSYGAKLQNLETDFKEIRKAAVQFLVNALFPIVKAIATFIGIIKEVPKFVKENKEELILLGIAIATFNIQATLASANALRLAAAQRISAISTAAVTTAQWLLNAALTSNPIGLVITGVALLSAAFIKAYKSSETLRGGIAGLFEAGKEVIKILGEGFKAFGEGFDRISKGDFKGAFSKFGEGLIKTNPVGLAFTQGERLGNAFNKGFNDKIASEKTVATVVGGKGKKGETIIPGETNEQRDARLAKEDEERKKRKEANDKAREKEEKAQKEHEARIAELKKKIRDLSAKEIANEFDRQIEQAKNKAKTDLAALASRAKELKGKKDFRSVEEAKLIDQETALIKKSLDEQIYEIQAKRQAAYDAANEQLLKYQVENLKILQDASVKAQQASIANIEAEGDIRIAEINLRYDKEIAALNENLENRKITQDQYEKAINGIDANRDEEILSAEKELSDARLAVLKNYYIEKQKLVDAQAQAELLKLDFDVDKEKEALSKNLADGLIQEEQYRKALFAIDEKYAAQQKQLEKDTTEEKKVLNNAFAKAVIDNDIKQVESATAKTQKEIDAEDEKAKVIKEIIEASLNIASQLSDALFSAAQDNADREKEAKLKSLDDEYEKRFEAAKGNATLEAGLKKQLEEEKNAIEKKAFEENKKRQIAQAIINGALAITNVLATVPLVDFGIARAIQIAVTAASTAIQVATIKNAKFARGGFTGFGHGAPDETGHVPVGVVHANEWVANPEMVRDNPELFQRLEFEQATKYRRATHKKLFADGGFTTNVPDVIGINKVAQAKQSAAVFSQDQIMFFAQEVAREVAQRTGEAVENGSMKGVYTGQNEVNRLRERQDVLATNSTF